MFAKEFDNNSENLNEEENSSINLNVPVFPVKKAPSYSLEGMQILKLLGQFRQALGNQKRELECQLIRKLINRKKNIEVDWFRLDGVWAIKYNKYLYDNSNTLPGPIDNTDLLRGTQLILNRDYFIVNETVWKFLIDQYGGGPEILNDKIVQSPLSIISSSTADRAKSADISMISTISQQEKTTDIPLKGLKNELYFCYMHSVLQCLMNLQDLNNFLLNTIEKYQCKRMIFCKLYQELLIQIQGTKQEYIKVQGLRSLIIKKFHPKHQHDAQEFLLFLISSIEDEILDFNKELQKEKIAQMENVIQYTLKGQLVSEIICKNCKNKSIITEEFLTLSLALGKCSTINQCLEEFLKDEQIQDYKCDNCHKKKTAIKKTKITTLPRYLILHLKRFKFFPKSNKIAQHIKYSLESNFCNQEYRLNGIIVHSGSLEQGHYYSYGRRQHKWWMFNDQKVKQVNKMDVVQQQAYILFYQQLL